MQGEEQDRRGDHARHQGTLLDPLCHLDADSFPLTFSMNDECRMSLTHMSHIKPYQESSSVLAPAMITHDMTRTHQVAAKPIRRHATAMILLAAHGVYFFTWLSLALRDPLSVSSPSLRSNFVRRLVVLIALDPSCSVFSAQLIHPRGAQAGRTDGVLVRSVRPSVLRRNCIR